MRYLLNTTEKYRVATVEEVEALHEEFLNSDKYTLASFGYVTKYIKAKGEIVEEYQVVTAKKVFNEEKDPENSCYSHVDYGMESAF